MERNSVIVGTLEKSLGDKLPRTSRYQKSFDEMSKLEKEFLALIGNDKQLMQMYLAIESVVKQNNLEYESMCFCEGVRLGFKLCMDIFNI